tara:strand:- start:741 stop:1430 length:690 start_codon:yes stop_codon:yes gene_type:complete
VLEELGPLLRALRAARPEVWIGGLLGNDDLPGAQVALDALAEEGLWCSLHLERHLLGEFGGEELWIAGYSGVPITPFRLSDWDRPDLPGWAPERAPEAPVVSGPTGALEPTTCEALLARPSVADELRELTSLGDMKRTIYVTHSPPSGAGLGVMHGGRDIGSQAIRAWIEVEQPSLTLHGHVHESPRESGQVHALIGGTRACNPGDSRRQLRALWVDLSQPGAAPTRAS